MHLADIWMGPRTFTRPQRNATVTPNRHSVLTANPGTRRPCLRHDASVDRAPTALSSRSL